MDIIHLTVEGKSFNVPRLYLEKFGFFRDMLAIYDESESKDAIELKNIDPYIFKILMKIVTNEVNVGEKIAVLCDYLSYDHQLDIIQKYYCKFVPYDCTNIAVNQYCVKHKCKIDNCDKQVLCDSNYCQYHECSFDGCHESGESKDRTCKLHQCIVDNCIYLKQYGDYCRDHGKLLYSDCIACKKACTSCLCCREHICCECYLPKIPASRYCWNHYYKHQKI